ncbi:ATP12 family chaperone protein [Labrys wisconsinensis]|uniref:Chaperone required for assembly of F1-ATPase n=1 Tax=Labrys wisconsinensis TaxID=425677 RepID=A0ABU0JJD8_9HYPH|nr:ATP12 family protein [Labrys wisconsinensis]MDQ0474402.1 chaperone required for assembly of F1-ATPase [Labrys wisconsinensis]
MSDDWFPEGSDPDPRRAAQKGLRPELPRRFYTEAGVVERDGLFALALDGRVARTPGKRLLAVPSRALAEALAGEWAAQGERIDPSTMPMTRIVNSALDGVAEAMPAVAAEIARYAGSDLLCYRAAEPERLVLRQAEAWTPLLDWAATRYGARLVLAEGIVFAEQPAEALAAIEAALTRFGPIGLAALHVLTTLTGSAVLALAVAERRLEPEAAWAAAHVDEDFQTELWGADEEAQARRAARWREMEAAARVLALGGRD